MHTQWWKYRPLVHDPKAQLLPTKSRNAPTTSKQFGQNVERIAKKNANLGPRPQTAANCARDQIASLDISKWCRIVRRLVVCWTKYEYDSALERVTKTKTKTKAKTKTNTKLLNKIWVWQCVGESDRAETISTDRAPRQAARIPNMLLNCWSAVAALLFYCSELPN